MLATAAQHATSCTVSQAATPSLQPLLTRHAVDLTAVDIVLHREMASQAWLIPQLSTHLIDAGGKRIRPLLLLASAGLLATDNPDIQQRITRRAINMAAAVEFIHTATLLHDDVVDESDKRRGKESANRLWGNKASVLVGDFLFSRAFQLMVADGSLAVLGILSKASAVIAEGEVLQLAATGNLATGLDGYLRVIKAKTAALFAAACEVGAIIAMEETMLEKTTPEETQRNDSAQRDPSLIASPKSLYTFGEALGIAFQIRDDVRDYSAVPGKDAGNDFAERKVTAPVLFALEQANQEQQEFWQRTIGMGEQSAEDYAIAQQYITQHQAVPRCRELAATYFESGENVLPAGNSEARDGLLSALATAVDF